MQKGLKKYFVNMDEYLCSLGLYRKMVARDASSLFRAVSEQLYYSQNYHQRIRQDCADFMRANRCNFEPFVEGSFEKYLERLEDPKETVGQVEIKALSQLYRHCFLIYRYPGKPATVISEDDFVDKVTLCCSINGHYDIVYPRTYPVSAALCQSLFYELLYTQVFGFEEAELCQAMEAFRVGGRRYRNSPSVCSDVDFGYDTPEDRCHREETESGGASDDKQRPPAEAPPPSRLSLPYKVMKSLDGEAYRNLEFDVWQDTCKEMQKTDYMVFAGRQYFLGDKCQVRLEPKGKYYNAFIQEVGTHSSAVTVFIEELGEKHLVPLTDLKPVNPVPAWNVAAPIRKGDLGLFTPRSTLCPPLQMFGLIPSDSTPAGHPRPLPSSTRFLNRHLIGPQLTYYHPGRRYYHDYESYAFRSRRSRRQLATALNKDGQYGFPAEAEEEPSDLDATITFYQLDDADNVFPPLAVRPGNTTVTYLGHGSDVCNVASSLEPGCCPASLHGSPAPSIWLLLQGSERLWPLVICSSPSSSSSSPSSPSRVPATAHLPAATQTRSGTHTHTRSSTRIHTLRYTHTQVHTHSHKHMLRYTLTYSHKHMLRYTHTHTMCNIKCFLFLVAMAITATSPWLVNELGEPLCTMVAPPPYSYDLNGSDLPRGQSKHRPLQWYHQSCWQQQQAYPATSPDASYPYQHYTPYLNQEPPLHGKPTLPLIGCWVKERESVHWWRCDH
uniref:ubiquitinyl hydrolase 1 n=1 Tax=Cyclopterus lumpus TaxID=8103 RepID=A0A8C2Z8A8_CYCLU